jgi:hypothetical protein
VPKKVAGGPPFDVSRTQCQNLLIHGVIFTLKITASEFGNYDVIFTLKITASEFGNYDVNFMLKIQVS